MLKLVMVLSVVLSSQAAAQQSDTPAMRQSILRTSEAARAYAELRSVSVAERAETLQQMSPSTQSAVWAHHLLNILAENPELTREQRALVQEGLALLTPDLFAIDRESPHWPQLVHEPLASFTERAKKLFPPRTARELFTDLGPDVRQGSVMERYATGRSISATRPSPRLTAPDNSPPCECSVASDYCDWSGFDYLVCRNSWCVFASSGCGTFGRYACEGLCRRR